MIKNRIIWIIIIISATLMYLFANETFTLALLVLCIAAPAISGSMLLAGSRVSADIEEVSEADGTQTVRLKVMNPGILPVASAEISIECRNLRTGRCEAVRVIRSIPGHGTVKAALDMRAAHAGVYEMRVVGITMSDPLAIFRKNGEENGALRVTVIPGVFDIPVTLSSSSSVMQGMERYSDRRSGNDPGEVRNIHEYVPGDPVKNIHWKLSEKTDRVLVKELGLPIMDRALVLMDTAGASEATDEANDAAARVYMSLLFSLLSEGIDVSAGWLNEDGSTVTVRKLTVPEDIPAAADGFLAAGPAAESIIRYVDREEADRNHAHMIIVCPNMAQDTSWDLPGKKVTYLCCGGTDVEIGGTYTIGFDEDPEIRLSAGITI